MSNSLMRGLYSGLIAGIIGGLGATTIMFTAAIIGIPSSLSGVPLTFSLLMSHLGYSVPATAIFGSIFGIIYSRLHDGVPGRGVVKGLVFGMIVFLFSNVYAAESWFFLWLLTKTEIFFTYTVSWLLGFLVWISYGIVLEPLYERLKL